MKYAIAMVLISACGYPPLDHTNVDANTHGDGQSDKDASPHDAPIHDGPTDAPGNGCPAPASFAGGATTNNSADHFPMTANFNERYFFAGTLDPALDHWLLLDLEDTAGVFTNGIRTGTFNITGAELNFDSCGACVVVAANCNGCNVFDGTGGGDYYMATAGTLKITTLSPNLTGTLTNMTFAHVTIDNTGANPTFHSTALADGCMTQVASRTFSQHTTNH